MVSILLAESRCKQRYQSVRYFDRNALMHTWRYAVSSPTVEALKGESLTSDFSAENLGRVFVTVD